MPRFHFRTPDLEDYDPVEDDWLEFPDLNSACLAAEVALREMAADGDIGPSVSHIEIIDEQGTVLHRAALEVRTEACTDEQTGKPKH